MFKSLTVLGSTGSIGVQTLQVLRLYRREIEVVALSAGGRNLPLLAAQVDEFRPKYVHVGDSTRVEELRKLLPSDWKGILLHGSEGLVEVAATAPADLVMVATVGWVGLEPALAAIHAGRHLAIANKEVLVCGGHLITRAASEKGVLLLPVDSEHNAIFQCLKASPAAPLRRIVLTCSGGPYLHATDAEIAGADAVRTLKHPTWDMGAKITVDSATLINKGFEVIEAHHLFQVPYEKIQVIIHPQSTIHSMVEFVDGSILAQLGQTDMSIPIAYALTYPQRRPTTTRPLDFARLGQLTFLDPDLDRFPALSLAYTAGQRGGSAPCVLNAANEVAVALHLDGMIPCGMIPRILIEVMSEHEPEPNPCISALRQWDAWGRDQARAVASRLLPAVAFPERSA
ncbi:MAG: 1-deoxy-D-xylulose-5-phosphate reductoisomerase [Candidatus Sumerlaeia bacterium]|nr:1-deoxy-D-xylulose-5-phosphate reductoisomerase [Candidatus Sumerlaeia bacterium]